MTHLASDQLQPSTHPRTWPPGLSAYRDLIDLGFDASAAANLTALVNGIAIGPQPWTILEIGHLFFLRDLNHQRGEWSDAADRAVFTNLSLPSWQVGHA